MEVFTEPGPRRGLKYVFSRALSTSNGTLFERLRDFRGRFARNTSGGSGAGGNGGGSGASGISGGSGAGFPGGKSGARGSGIAGVSGGIGVGGAAGAGSARVPAVGRAIGAEISGAPSNQDTGVAGADVRVPLRARSAGGRLSRQQYEVDAELYPLGGLDVFVRMQRDAQVRACLTTKRLSVLSETITVHPAGDSALARRAAAIVEAQLAAVAGGPAAIVTGALDALAMGFAIGEMLWNPDGSLARVYWHDPRRFVFHGDDFGDIEAVEVIDAALRWPRDRFVIYTYQGRYGNPYGESDLVSAYRSWSEKDTIRRMWLIALDKFGTPTPVARIPLNYDDDSTSRLTHQLETLQSTSALVVTNDVEIAPILDPHRVEPGAGFATSVMYQDAQIARAILGQEMTTSGNSGSGGSSSQALATVHLDVQTDWIQSLRADVAECVLTNQIAAKICAMALGPDAPVPTISFPNLSPAELAGRQAVVTAMIAGNVIAPDESWIRSYLGLPEAGSGDDTPPRGGSGGSAAAGGPNPRGATNITEINTYA